MTISEIYKKSKETIKEDWFKISISIFLSSFIPGLLITLSSLLAKKSLDAIGLFLQIFALLITPALTFGIVYSIANIKEGRKYSITEFITIAFDNFGKAWGLSFRIGLKAIIPLVLAIILSISTQVLLVADTINKTNAYIDNTTAITTSASQYIVFIALAFAMTIWAGLIILWYSLSYVIAHDNPEKTNKEVIQENKRLLKGNRLKLIGIALPISLVELLLSFLCKSPNLHILNILNLIITIILQPLFIQLIITFYRSLVTETNNEINTEINNAI